MLKKLLLILFIFLSVIAFSQEKNINGNFVNDSLNTTPAAPGDDDNTQFYNAVEN